MTQTLPSIGTTTSPETLDEFNGRIGQDDMVGQWTFEPLLDAHIGGPKPRGDGHVWPWSTSRTRLAEASAVLGAAGVGRCNLTFTNPGITQGFKGSTHTMSIGVQIMRAQEVCWSHRHSMSALRFVLEGNEQAYTAVDGEKLAMGTYDLLLTPRFSWHDHHNPTDDEIVWLDVLDIGIAIGLNQIFYEKFGEASQPERKDAAESQQVRVNSNLRPTWEKPRQDRLPVRYKWSDVVEVLDSYGDAPGDPYDGLALRYANPVTGGPTLSTMDCWVQQLVPGFEGKRHRRTSSSVGHVVSGRGRIEVEGKVLEVGPGDSFAIPNYAWHRLSNASEEVLRIFSVHDTPAVQALGLFYEEPSKVLAATPAPPVPGVPHSPVYRADVLLSEDEVR